MIFSSKLKSIYNEKLYTSLDTSKTIVLNILNVLFLSWFIEHTSVNEW